jgi:hypothetical protein
MVDSGLAAKSYQRIMQSAKAGIDERDKIDTHGTRVDN